ncbi:MAG TPA: tetratricopeptide repeat protein [Gemmatimonadales bacterium]|jgi:tetratricopeptide (TPR) repeat protein
MAIMPPARPDPASGPTQLAGAESAQPPPLGAVPRSPDTGATPARDRSQAERRLQQADDLAAGTLPGAAVRPYRELLELEPAHIEGRLHFARLLDRLEEASEAVDVLSEGLRRAPDQTEFLVLRGAILGRLQRYREAETDLRRALRLHPSHAPAQFELGLLLWRRGLVQEAAACFHRALEFQPDNAKTYYYLGDALNQMGDLPGARAAVERAIQVSPGDAKTYHLMGRVLDRMSLPEQAQEMYRRGRELAGL